MKNYTLYCLYDNSTFKIRYIGITSQKLLVRLYQHTKSSISGKNSYKINWITSINKNIGIRSLMSNISFTIARKNEIELIKKYKNSHKLVNLQDRGACGDLRTLSKTYCDKISNTLKYKYENNIIPIQGEKEVHVYSSSGKFVKSFKNRKKCSDFLKIPYSKIGSICKNGGYYKNYTFTSENKVPFNNYIKCFDIVTGEINLFLKKEDLSIFFKVRGTPYNKLYNSNVFYKLRYNIRTDNNYPPLYSNLISYNDNIYTNLSTLIKENRNIKFTAYADIRACLSKNLVYINNNIEIKNVSRAWYKFGELLETLEDFKTTT